MSPGVPTTVHEMNTRPMEIAVSPTPAPAAAPAAASTQVDMRAAAVASALTAMVEAFTKAPADGKAPPPPARGLPGWASGLLGLLVALFGTGGVSAGVLVSNQLDEVEAKHERMQLEWAAMQATTEADREALHRNDAALGKWAVDMTREVGAGLVSLDQLSRAIAKAQGVDVTSISAPSLAEPGVTVRQLGLQAEAEGL
jgi:hypothetical protein